MQAENAQGLRAAVLKVADLVIADATPTKSKHHGRPFASASPKAEISRGAAGGSSCSALAEELDGEAYLQIRAAFSAAFEALEQQPAPAPDQVHELWATTVDYMDRLVARANMALTAADCLHNANLEVRSGGYNLNIVDRELCRCDSKALQCSTHTVDLGAHGGSACRGSPCNLRNYAVQLEQHICQLAARCGDLRKETGQRLSAHSLSAAQLKDASMAQAAATSSKGKAAAHADPAPQAHCALPSATWLQSAAGDAGRPRSTAADAKLERTASAKSVALRLATQEAGFAAGTSCPDDGLQPALQEQRAVWQVRTIPFSVLI